MLAATLLLPSYAAAGPARDRPSTAASINRDWQSRAGHAVLRRLAGREPVRLAQAVAARYWGAAPCGGHTVVMTNMPLPAGLEPDTDAWVTFDSSLGVNDLQAPATTYTQCVISVARWQWPTRRSMANDWNMFCLTMIHETGHLLGHAHSSTPGSVMAPVFTAASPIPTLCRTARPRTVG